MTLATLIWTVACLWVAASCLTPSEVRYPKIGENVTLTCDTLSSHEFQAVFWFRIQRADKRNATFQYLLQITQASRVTHSVNVDEERFTVTLKGRKGSSLRIFGVTERDAGIYSCVFDRQKMITKQTELWRPGVRLRPGETPPTPPPVTNPPRLVIRSNCRCPKSSKKNPNGCRTMVLWPLVGVLLGLAVAVISTLYYFSRLPRKCRHRFAKKRVVN